MTTGKEVRRICKCFKILKLHYEDAHTMKPRVRRAQALDYAWTTDLVKQLRRLKDDDAKLQKVRGAALMRQYKADDAKREKARERVERAAKAWEAVVNWGIHDWHSHGAACHCQACMLASAVAALRRLEAKKP